MAGLQRFITYIYKYKDDEKMENAGFAKIEIRGGQCRMEVHIRNVGIQQPEATIYLFARNEKIMQGIPVGSITISRGNGDVRYSFETKELSNFGLTMDDMEGILIPLEENDYLASQWKEGTIAKNLFRIMEKKEEFADSQTKDASKQEASEGSQNASKQEASEGSQNASKQEASEGSQNASKQEASERSQNAPNQKMPERSQNAANQKMPEKSQNAPIKESKNENQNRTAENEADVRTNAQNAAPKEKEQPIQATGLPEEEFFEEAGWERIFQKLRLKLDIFYPFEGQDIECVRMQLNDLQEFPKKYWYIGNNSFLLHGFFNYRHVIFGEIKEESVTRHFIGVPGIFQNQERVMAALFGFPEFRTAKSAEYKTGNFGYWYRFI